MNFRRATPKDAPLLGRLNVQLIQDEGHGSPLTVAQLTDRMRDWLATVYTGVIFEDERGVVAYAVFQEEVDQVYLRQFFVVREHRRQGVGRLAMHLLFRDIWPQRKRLTVSVLADNLPARAFWRAVGYSEYSLTLEIRP